MFGVVYRGTAMPDMMKLREGKLSLNVKKIFLIVEVMEFQWSYFKSSKMML